jgi:ABC-type polysaccharide/polyol phosphate export permease
MTNSSTTAESLFGAAWTDFLHGVYAWRLWSRFAWHDLLSRYRRSWLGPLWIAMSAAVFIGALSFLYSTLFRTNVREYVPYVAIGFVAWSFISVVTSESVTTFVDAEGYIRQIRVNLFVYVLRVVSRNVLVFAHQFVVVLLTLIIFAAIDFRLLPLAALGIFLFLLQAVWVAPLLGLAGARFRDLQPMIANLLQVLFFVTPVIWSPDLLGSKRWIADCNPLSSLIAIVREPLLGRLPSAENYAVVLSVTVVGFALAMLIYGRYRLRLVYWL